jgi:hypothetical protein
MDLIWDIGIVFGLVSLLILVIGIWTHLNMRKKQRKERMNSRNQKRNMMRPNEIAGANAGGPRLSPVQTRLAARIAQLWR